MTKAIAYFLAERAIAFKKTQSPFIMPQLQALALNEQILRERELNQYIFAQANAIAQHFLISKDS
ncbi:hypothetical protein WA1_42330 [Scytonema hofmannii PCC 7110]|uniref:Uncharacterized protein n=1 Tax=Scytonema hofmannii PCC 7110 TaxID=128403 RepID=A0A139WV93_9CYAN|nr:hypothetical protein [Scytonema hofmannii]KYC36356.1 hypothetical protein WA1_42330 [Scytonema hofmannii PCC 7110]